MNRKVALLSVVLAAIATAQSVNRTIAITIDDLPCAGGCRGLAEMQSITTRTLEALQGVPTTAFVNESQLQVRGERDARVSLLEQWLAAGHDLGNHTYSHPSPNNVSIEAYEADVLKGEVILRSLQPNRKRFYFRHPYTHTGPAAAYKTRLESFLDRNGYDIAPFTIDNSDWAWALVHRRAVERKDQAMADRARKEYLEHLDGALAFAEQASLKMFQREIPQVLLIHANLLHAETMPDLLGVLRRRGYRIVPLANALSDPAYSTPDRFIGRFGPSWLQRWSVALGQENPMTKEPPLPGWLTEEFQRVSRR
jgi:peptidoglycan/xylan/chitin deacetylase (PgdA/CDA1 family)